MVGIVSGNSLGLSASSLTTLAQKGPGSDATQGRSAEQVYVNVSNGNLVLQRQDEYLASVGIDAAVVRTYNSQGVFDEGQWSYGLQRKRLDIQGTGVAADITIARTDQDGARLNYTYDAVTGKYVNHGGDGAYDTLEQTAGQWVWTDGATGIRETYDSTGILRSQSDTNGSTTTLSYNPDGLLESVTTASGETTRYDYSNGRITQIRVLDQSGATSTRVRYGYDGAGRLSTVTVDLSPSDNAIADQKTYVTTYGYDGNSKRVASITQSDGTALTISYTEVGGTHRVASITDGAGKTTQYAYDLAGLRTVITDPLGAASSYTYDASGQLTGVRTGITVAQPDGLTRLAYAYDDKGNLVSMTDAFGQSISYQYDTNGNQTVKSDPLGNTVKSTYNTLNQLLTQTIAGTDGTSLTTRYVYDSDNGRLQRFRISPEGRVREFRYDAQGQLITTLEYTTSTYATTVLTETAVPDEAQMQSWAAGHGAAGALRTDIGYDFRGQIQTSTSYESVDAAGNGSQASATHYVYGQAGELLQIVRPNQDSITQHVYDGLGRLIVSTEPSPSGGAPTTVVVDYADAARTVTTTRANGLTTLSSYDVAGRLISVSQSHAGTSLGVTRYSYDAVGRLTMTEDPTGVRQWMIYDDGGRKVADIDGTGAAIEYAYNNNGQLTETIAYAVRLATPVSAPTINAVRSLASSADRKSWRIYDDAQRLALQVDSLGYVTRTEYDGASRIAAVKQFANPIDVSNLGNAAQFTVKSAPAPDGRGLVALALRLSPAALVQGTPMQLTAAVIGNNPTGTVVFYNGSTVLGRAQLLNGMATLALAEPPQGALQFTARFEGDANNAEAVSPPTSAIAQSSSPVQLGVSPAFAEAGENITLAATLAPTATGGTVAFFSGSTLLGTAVAANGLAQLVIKATPPGLAVGTAGLSATYLGDDGHRTSASAVVPYTIVSASTVSAGPGSTTSVRALTAVPSATAPGEPLALTARIEGNAPQGKVTFLEGSHVVGVADVINGVATLLIPSGLSAGTHALVASYSGDTNNAPSLSARSVTVTVASALPTPSLALTKTTAADGSVTVFIKTQGSGSPTGQITLRSGNTVLGTVDLVHGLGSLVLTTPPAGDATLSVDYAGDALHAATTASAKLQDIAAAQASITLRASVSDQYYSTADLRLTAMAEGAANGSTITFYDGDTLLGQASVVNGIASLTVGVPAGLRQLRAEYQGAGQGQPISSATTSIAAQGSGTGIAAGLSWPPNPAWGDTTKFWVSLWGGAPPGGTVSFFSNGVLLGSAILDAEGDASFSTRDLPAGSNSVTVVYSGDDGHVAITSSPIAVDLAQTTTTTTLSASRTQSVQGEPISWTAKVMTAANEPAPSGVVKFYSGTTLLGQANVANGVAVFTTSALPAGMTSIHAIFDDGTPVHASTSEVATARVNVPLDFSATPVSTTLGENVTLTARIEGNAPQGKVTFLEGSHVVGVADVINGVATLLIPSGLSAGTHALVASYSGDTNNAPSLSARSVTVTVASALPTPSLALTKTTAADGSVTVFIKTQGSGSPTGQITLRSGNTVLGTVDLVHGLGSLVLTTPPAGDATLSVDYAGDALHAATTASAKLQDIAAAQASITLRASVSDQYYSTADLRLTAMAEGAANGSTITFYDGDTLLGQASVVNGIASLTVGVPAGLRQLRAEYQGAGQGQPISSATTSIAAQGSGTGIAAGLSWPPNPAWGDTTKFWVSLWGGAPPGGTVSFFSNGVLLGSAILDAEGDASFSTRDLPAGSNSVTVVYSGDDGHVAITSSPIAVDLAQTTTTTTLSASRTQSVQGEPISWTAKVMTAANEPAPSGVVKFYSGTTLLGQANVANGVAVFTTSALPAGMTSIHAIFDDGKGNTSASANTSQMVFLSNTESNSAPKPPVQLSSSSTTALRGGFITIQVNGTNPTGHVALLLNGACLAVADVIDNMAKIPVGALPSGTSQLVATYSGDANNAAGQIAFTQTLQDTKGTSVTELTGFRQGEKTILQARVVGSSPWGQVSFYKGGTLLGIAPLVSGSSMLVLGDALAPEEQFTAVFSGDELNGASTSKTLLASGVRTAAPGTAVSTTDRVVRQIYSKDGQLLAAVDGEGYLQEMRYDAAGRQIGIIRYATRIADFSDEPALQSRLQTARNTSNLSGLRPASSAGDSKTYTLYNAQSQVVASVDAEGYFTEFAYDLNGNLAQTTRYAQRVNPALEPEAYSLPALRPTPSAQDQTVRKEWNARNLLVQETAADGTVTKYSYDVSGNLVSTTKAAATADSRGVASRYDAQGQVTAELSSTGVALLNAGQTQAQIDAIWNQYGLKHAYDLAGRRTSTTDANGNKTLYFYDADQRLTHVVNALGEVVENQYNAFGQIATTVRYGTRISLAGLTGSNAGGLVNAALTSALNAARNATVDSKDVYTYATTGALLTHGTALGLLTSYAYNAFREESARTLVNAQGTALQTITAYDRRGLKTTETRDPGGLNTITSAVYDAFGRVTNATDAMGNTRSQAYDRLGRTVSQSNALGQTDHTAYDAFARIVSHSDALGNTTTYAYDHAARSLTVTSPEGIQVKTIHDRTGQVQTVIDGRGNSTTYTYDADGHPTGTTTALTSTSKQYDGAGRLIQTTDANGVKVNLTYDAANRLLTRTVDPTGLNLVTAYTYDAKGQQLSVTDPNGSVTRYTYDLQGQLTSQAVDPNGLNLVTRYTYDTQGHTLSVTDPNGSITHYTYDAAGRRTKEQIDPTGLNLTRSYSYDKNDNVTKIVDANGNASYRGYDAENRLTYTVDGAGDVVQTVYDAVGRVAKTIAYKNAIQTAGLDSAAVFGPGPSGIAGQIAQRLAPSSSDSVEYRMYNGEGWLMTSVNALGEATAYTRDANGNVLEQRRYATRLNTGNAASWTTETVLPLTVDDAHDLRIRSAYDALGRATYSMDGTGAVVRYVYDGNGNMRERTAFAQRISASTGWTETDFAYAVSGQAQSAQNVVQRFGYDNANRLLWSVDGVGAATRNAYDKNGNLIKSVRLATPVGAGDGQSTPGFIESAGDAATDHVYDAANRRVYTINALGGVTQTGYDANGNVTQRLEYATTITPPSTSTGVVFGPSVSNYTLTNIRSALGGAADYQPGNRLTQYAYDAADRLAVSVNATGAVTRTDYGTNTVTTTQYAAPANTSGLTATSRPQDILARVQYSSDDRQTTQVLDAARRVVLSIDAQGYATATAYDGLGQVTSTVAYAAPASGTQAVATPGQDRTTTFRYDAAGRLIGSTDALQGSESYAYDALGNKASFTNKKGSRWEYQYDAAGRMVLELSPQVQLASLVTDANGRLAIDASQTGAAQIATQLEYDTFGNLAARTEALGRPEARTTRYEYDALGRQTKVFLPVTGVYDANSDNLVNNGQNGNAGRIEAAVQLWTETRYDALGNAVAGRDTAGNWSYKAYDRLGQLAYEMDAEGFVTGYTRNRWGEAESLVRYAEKSTLGLVAGTAPSTADLRSHMAAKSSGANREFLTSYDRMGRVLQVQEPLVFNYDSESGVQSQGRKTTVNSYDTFGDLIGVSKNLGDARWSTSTNRYDQLGRIVSATDALGFTTTWSYDAAGNTLRKVEYASAQSTAGTAPNISNGDRVTDFSYDLLNRKSAEIRRGAGYAEIDPNAAWSLVERPGDLTTSYTYDALGNLVRTTDAAGGNTYSYYDALGRVTAVVAPAANTGTGGLNNGERQIAALTEFSRDAHGNVLVSIERATGALGANEAGYTTAVAPMRDRVSLSRFDAQGHLVQTADAEGANRYFSYNAQGQIGKEWQTVSVLNEQGAKVQQTLWRAYEYDKVGRQTHTYTPLQQGAAGPVTKGDTSLTYNAFGEVTQREVRNGQTLVAQEKQEYDNAGRLWRSNAGDGVTKVMAYNLQGQQTVQLIASGSITLDSYASTQAALNGQYMSPGQFRRTDMRYDALGRLTQTLAPERVSDQAMSISTRESLVYGIISQTQVVSGHPINTSINQVDLVWRSLQNLGSGDVRITLTYDTKPYTAITNQESGTESSYPATLNQKISVVVSAEEAVNGYVLKWSTDDLRRLSDGRTVWSPGQPLGIGAIKGIKVEKMDLFGDWATLHNVAPPAQDLSINWSETPSPGFIWSESGDGRIPIYRYYNRFSGAHYFSTSTSERDNLLNQQQGWLDEGTAGYVSASPAAGLVPIYRLTMPGKDGAIYARSSELSTLASQGWVNKGVDGYVGDPAGNAPLGMVKLYSLQNNLSPSGVDSVRTDGLYTTALSDRNALLGITPPAPGSANPRQPTVYAAAGGLSIEVTYPQDLISSTTLEYRPAGSSGIWSTAPTSIQRAFGSAARFDVSQLGLSPGGYEYRIRNTNPEKTRDVGSGTFTIYGAGVPEQASMPVLSGVHQSTANIDGTFYKVLQWPKPSSDWTVTFRYWPKGNPSAATTRAVGSGIFSYGDGRTSGMGVGMQGIALNLGTGDFDYEVLAQKSGGAEQMHATGTLSLSQGVSSWDSTPPITQGNNNVTNLGIVGYVWTSPAPGRVPLYRYYMPYNNDHHVTTADPSVIALFEQVIADYRANPSSPEYARFDGIVGYVESSPTSDNQRLYQYKYGNENIYRLTANPSDIGWYQTLYSPPSSLTPGVWYQSAYQFDGYISKVPAAGTTALYAVYDGNSFGPLSQGDYLTTSQEQEVLAWYMMNASNSATAKVPGVKTSTAQIDGQMQPVLQWQQPEAGARVTVTASPALPSFGSSPAVFTQGDSHGSVFSAGGSQGIVLSTMQPGASYTISVVIEYPATPWRNAYKARTDFTINVPASGPNAVVGNTDTTQPYTPGARIVAGTPYNLSSRAITTRGYDRWGNLTAYQDPRVLDGTGTQRHTTTYRYNASNQLIEQTLPQNYAEGASTTRIYYDQLGREIGVRDGEGNLNIKVYDAAGNLVQKRNADGGRTDYRYNAFGDRTASAEVIDAQRTVVTHFAYDKLSRLTSTSLERAITRYGVTSTDGTVQDAAAGGAPSANGVTLQTQEQTLLERVEYDEAGRRVRVINGNDESTRYVYDRAGNVVYSGQEASLRPAASTTLPDSYVLKYGFAYEYDALGRKISQADANGLGQTWSYNTLGRLVGHSDNNGAVQYNYAYNLAGQLTHEGNNASLKKDIDYQYDGAGQLTRIQDNFLGQTSTYSYDLAGNRIAERITQKTFLANGDYANVVYQDNRLAYDAQNRLRAVFDGRVDVRIDYDLAGNRSRVSTKVTTQSGGTEQIKNSATLFTYDSMNRQKGSSEYALNITASGPQLGALLERHNYVYDLGGNRIADNSVFIKGGGENGTDVNGSYAYTYDDLHRMVSYNGYGLAERQTYQYDGAGRVAYTMSLVRRDGLWQEEHRYNQYDATGKLQDTRAVLRHDETKAKTHVDDIRYHDTTGSNAATGLGYDAAGNLKGYQQISDGSATTTRYQYATQNGSYLQSQATTTHGGTTATSNTWRDANGFISNITENNADGSATFKDLRFNRAFVNDAQGNALYVNQAAGQTGRIQNGPGGYIGGWVGDSLDPGHIQRQLVANGEVLGRYGDAPDRINTTPQGQVPKYVHTTDFQLEAQVLNLKGASVDPVSYTVVGGETLRDVARNVLGDAGLWWRIADANALAVSADAPLTAGQTLSVPKLALNANSAETFQPYDPSKITGSMDPTLPMPAQGDKCGGMGKIIMAVVAIVVTIYTAGALSAGTSGFFSTMQAGTSALAGGGGLTAGGAALSAAAGSVVSQVVGNALGVQDGFSWKAVALSALSGGIGFGLSEMGVAGSIAKATSSNFLGAAGQAAIASALTQGVSVATGLQRSFDWRGVAASAVGAGAGAVVGESLGMNSLSFKTLPFGEQFGARLATGLVAGTAAAVARGGKVAIQQVATDAFGNALGSSLLDYASNPGSPVQEPMPSAQEAFRASEIAYRNTNDPLDMGGAYGLQVGRGGYGLSPSGTSLSQWSDEIDGGIMLNGSMAPEPRSLGQAVVGKNQGPLAALAAAGLDAEQQQAMYGQMRANGTIRVNAQGVPQVQPGQVLEFDLSDMSAGRLGASAIAQESRFRSERLAAAAQATTLDNRDARDIRAGFGYQSMLARGLSEADALASVNNSGRPAQYISQWDGVTRQAPIENYLQSTLGGLDPVRGSQPQIQLARSLPEAAVNELGGLAIAKVLGAGAQVFNAAVRSETSLLNAELKATVNNALVRDLPVGAPLEGMGVGSVANKANDFVTFYHGTSPQNAANIRLAGIDLSKSKAINDFGPGFYMTTSPEEAISSATMMSRSAQDVVEFRVPRSELGGLNSKVFNGADAEWADFVTMNRRLDTAPYLPPDEWGYTFDIVTGPMFGGVKKGGIRTLPGRGDQTSIHTQDAVDLFNRYMQGR